KVEIQDAVFSNVDLRRQAQGAHYFIWERSLPSLVKQTHEALLQNRAELQTRRQTFRSVILLWIDDVLIRPVVFQPQERILHASSISDWTAARFNGCATVCVESLTAPLC